MVDQRRQIIDEIHKLNILLIHTKLKTTRARTVARATTHVRNVDAARRGTVPRPKPSKPIEADVHLTKAQAEAAVNAFQDVFVEAMQSGEGLKLTGLFSAERFKRAARTGRNPRPGETIEIPATYGVRISAGSLLKKAVTK